MLSLREILPEDIEALADYWLHATPDFMLSMGADSAKLPDRESLKKMLGAQLNQSYQEKDSYALIWLVNQQPVGHCNVNKIIYGQSAFMHLHLWDASKRQHGMGSQLVQFSLPFFFKNLNLKILFCEPYALNNAPNKTLKKVGFTLEKEYITTPGYLNFEQPVKRWRLDKSDFDQFT